MLINDKMAREIVMRQPGMSGSFDRLFSPRMGWVLLGELLSVLDFECPFCGGPIDRGDDQIEVVVSEWRVLYCDECEASSLALRAARRLVEEAEKLEESARVAEAEVREIKNLVKTIEEKIHAKHRRSKTKAA